MRRFILLLLRLALLLPISLVILTMASGSLAFASSSQSSAGASLYDALKAIYGDSNSSSNQNSNQNGSQGGNISSNQANTAQTVTMEQIMAGMETEEVGPSVQEVSLSELYHENYKVYEERLTEAYVIYANVPNGGIINRPVLLDIPSGVGFSLNRDGIDIPYTSKEKLEKEGSYVMTFFVVDTTGGKTSFSEQKVSKAIFRFRIQYKQGVDGVVGYGMEEEAPTPAQTPAPIDDETPEDLLPDTYVYEEENVDQVEEETPSINEAPSPIFPVPEGGYLTSVYNVDLGYYENMLESGESFFSNVPNGEITNDAVLIQDAEGLSFTLYRNGKEEEGFAPGNYIQEPGSYACYIRGESPAFRNAYSGQDPAFRFRILRGPVNDITLFNAPSGSKFTSVLLDGEEASGDALLSDSLVYLMEDGDYRITISDEGGSREVSIVRDTVMPLFSIQTVPNSANITYYSNDIARCLLFREGELISDSEIITNVNRTGNYRITVYDTAGNVTSQTFRVSYQINAAAGIGIIAILAIIGGVIFYLVRIKKKVNVV